MRLPCSIDDGEALRSQVKCTFCKQNLEDSMGDSQRNAALFDNFALALLWQLIALRMGFEDFNGKKKPAK